MKKTKQQLLNGCLAAAVALSTVLTPFTVSAATPAEQNTVTRIGGFDKFETAALMSQKGWTGTSDNVVLSAGMTYNLVDALAAGPLAAKLNAPILLTDGGQTLNSFAKAELQRLKPKKVYLTSGTAVIKPTVVQELKDMGITPVPLGGYDQYETSVNIAKELALQGVDISRVVLAGGWSSPADALSVSSIAAAQGMPILTTAQGQLPASVKAYLDSIKAKVTDSYVVGGTAVIADAVKGELPGKVTRYAGLTKYDTNVQILKNFAKEYKNDKVYVANGESLVDALAGVPLAAANRSPVVLVNQQIDNTTREFVKLNMSTDDMVVLGGEAAVSAAGIDAITSVLTYATADATVGSTDPSKPETLTENVKITGDGVTLKNVNADYSIYVKGNNITLNNLTVKGTVFVDPGEDGTATLDGVTAGNIVILSGAPHSVVLKKTTSGEITVSTDGNTNVVLESVTTNGVTVQTYVVYETDASGSQVKTGTVTINSGAGNDLGEVTIKSEQGKTTDVSLSGEFKQPIKVEGQGATTINAAAGTVVASVTANTNALTLAGTGTYTAVVAQAGTLTAAAGTTLPSVTVAAASPAQTVTLAGTITNVTQTQGNLTLAAGTAVTSMTTTTSSTIIVPPTSSIGSLTSTAPTPPAIGGGGQVNGQTTPVTPPVTPPPVNPPVTPPSTGSSSTTLTISSVSALLNGVAQSPTVGTYNFNLSTTGDSSKITGLQVLSNIAGPDLVISSITARGVEWIKSGSTVRATVPSDGRISIGAILGGLDQGDDGISLGNLRFIFGNGDVVIKGKLTKSGSYTDSSEITVTITLGSGLSPVTSVDNTWMIIDKTAPKTVQVTVKSGEGDTTLGEMTGSNFNFAQVVAAIAMGEVNYGGGAQTAVQLQTAIASGALNFNSITLSQLVGKTIKFGGVNNDEFTVTFVDAQFI